MANHVEHHTEFWSNHGGGATINRLASQKYAGVHRDLIPPEVFTGVARLVKQARQDNLGKDRDDIDPMSLPDGNARRSKLARQANLGKDRDDIDPMSYPDGVARRSKQARQANLDVCYLDRKSIFPVTSNAIAAANAKVASLERAGYTVGISDLPGTTTTAYSVKEAYHILWGNANDTDDTKSSSCRANNLILQAFDRSRKNMHEGGFAKWSIAHGLKICFGVKKLDGSLPSFGPYHEGVKYECRCGNPYSTEGSLVKHQRKRTCSAFSTT
jgi:hypothetical protein